jgi:hypothetical protein
LNRVILLAVTFATVLLLGSCTRDNGGGATFGSYREIPGTQVKMNFNREGGLYDAPFPSEDLRDENGDVDISLFPNPDNIDFIKLMLDALKTDLTGFGLSSGVFFGLSGMASQEHLPDVFTSLEDGAKVFLVSVDESSSDYLRRYPVDVFFTTDGGPFGCKNMLVALPLQGVPLMPNTLYATVALRDLLDSAGDKLGVSAEMAELANGVRPQGMSEAAFNDYRTALQELLGADVPTGDVAGLAVFRTGDPALRLLNFRDYVLAQPYPTPNSEFTLAEVFPDYCIYHSTIDMPVYQAGEPPFNEGGGGWAVDAQGNPVLQREETANFWITLPRRAMPQAGFPLTYFVRTGGGGDRPLVDRGTRAVEGGESIEAGTGPAKYFAEAGFAGASVDGPHGGLRNITAGDEQFLMYNILNPLAMRDNIRQSALEIILLAYVLENVSLDASDCPDLDAGGATVGFDIEKLALMGHSTGASIGQPVFAAEPRFKAAIFSGAGGSWLANIMFKKRPLDTKPLAEAMLEYNRYDMELHDYDPALSLLQWGGEPSDAPIYNRLVLREPGEGGPRHVLMLQGIVDTYILPPIANATILSLNLDLAGPILDADHPDLAIFRPIEQLLQFTGRSALDLPVSGNFRAGDQTSTAVVVQHEEGPVEDGHEVVFQTEPPKYQYRCFLKSFAEGLPTVLPEAGITQTCP